MLRMLFIGLIILYSATGQSQNNKKMTENNQDKPTFAIALHGGAGNLKKKNYSPEQENAYKTILDSALTLGYKMLQNDSPATDVVVAVIKILEDSPLFNAGKGSVFSNEGANEMDAAIMEGEQLKCGAVTNIRTVKNPITLAECIMKKSKFIFLNGEGAEKFAKENEITIVDSSYFFDQKRWDEMLQLRNTNKAVIDNDRSSVEPEEIDKYGTVGCVVLDKKGNLAAGTSTGGLTNKKYNRIGDSPLIGAGTYANNKSCAVSCTGRGEDFIRIVAAHQLHNYMSMKNYSLKKAARTVIREDLKNIKGRGGLIAVDSKGNISFQFNTSGMFRAGIDKNGTKTLEIYKLEPEK
jgi:beta-aspartyl-peptidase (threonine type)